MKPVVLSPTAYIAAYPPSLLRRARLYFGGETGPLQLALAVGTPVVCLLGGGRFGRLFPAGDPRRNRAVHLGMDCFGCNWRCRYDSIRCIQEIGEEHAWRELAALLAAP